MRSDTDWKKLVTERDIQIRNLKLDLKFMEDVSTSRLKTMITVGLPCAFIFGFLVATVLILV